MKKRIVFLGVALMTILYSHAQQQLPIDLNKSTIKWSGEYTFHFGGHHGIVDFKEGYFVKSGDVISGGVFIIDMNSLRSLDIEDKKGRDGLDTHLKNADFFQVAMFPESALVITAVDYHDETHMKVYADLTIKGITNPISFQAEVDYKKEQMTTRFKIDRKRWGVNHSSSLQDGAISDGIGFEVTLTLK
ncbi:YceI family protein [Jejudonia soesokkakensis]|uniref:YceI family protein n=1 Tax=Jejudonia soesokkakensis TaxID=1323432 RepID=A0ABW2MSB8_9FLAO